MAKKSSDVNLNYSLDSVFGRKSGIVQSNTKIKGLKGLTAILGDQDVNQYLKPKTKKKK
jgi:hypothetical protein